MYSVQDTQSYVVIVGKYVARLNVSIDINYHATMLPYPDVTARTSCHVIVQKARQSQHVCGEFNYKICGKMVIPGHLCFIQCERPKEHLEKYLYFDFEADKSSSVHVVNYCVRIRYVPWISFVGFF